MNFREYLRSLRRRSKLIFITALVFVALASVLTYQATPKFRSTTDLFVSTGQDDNATAYTGSLYSAQRVQSYARLAMGADIARRVVLELGLTDSPAELRKRVSAQVQPETVILSISISDSDPNRAQAIATAYADALSELVDALETPPGQDTPLIKATTIDAASLPAQAYAPNWLANLLVGFFLGLGVGVALAFLREILDNGVTDPDDAARLASGPVMAQVLFDPDMTGQGLGVSAHSQRAEAFRILRTNMRFVDVDHANKVWVITSSVPGEGKTTAALTLAETMAQNGMNVVLVDADLRRPQIAERLNLESATGLTTALVGMASLDDVLQKSSQQGLTVLTSGPRPPNPVELIETSAMNDMMLQLGEKFDVVIMDCPPLLPVADAAILAARAGGCIMVVRHGKTTKEQLAQAGRRLGAVDARVFGVVLNMIKVRGKARGYDAYGYGYDYTPNPKQGKKAKRATQPSPPRRSRRERKTNESSLGA